MAIHFHASLLSHSVRTILIVTSILVFVSPGLELKANTRGSGPLNRNESPDVSANIDKKIEIADLALNCSSAADLIGLNPRRAIRCLRIESCSDRREDEGCYSVTFRIDTDYSKVSMKWYRLKGYSNETGRYEKKERIFDHTFRDYRRDRNIDRIFSLEANLESLEKGTYRIVLRGATTESRNNNSCELTYNFDGKDFTPVPGVRKR